jgi:hypothetical protein
LEELNRTSDELELAKNMLQHDENDNSLFKFNLIVEPPKSVIKTETWPSFVFDIRADPFQRFSNLQKSDRYINNNIENL